MAKKSKEFMKAALNQEELAEYQNATNQLVENARNIKFKISDQTTPEILEKSAAVSVNVSDNEAIITIKHKDAEAIANITLNFLNQRIESGTY